MNRSGKSEFTHHLDPSGLPPSPVRSVRLLFQGPLLKYRRLSDISFERFIDRVSTQSAKAKLVQQHTMRVPFAPPWVTDSTSLVSR